MTEQERILLINKPAGPTSHDIVALVRKKTGIKRVGHAGTLDPFAEGLLIVLVGRDATKRQSEFLGMDKTYDATLRLGARSTTDDPTGIVTIADIPATWQADLPEVHRVIHSFVGTYDQMPPPYSAKKINGKKAYELARKGIVPDLKPKKITVFSIDILSCEFPILTIRCTVSSGTYIRALARDIGEKLGCGAYLERLIRTEIGPYRLSDAIAV